MVVLAVYGALWLSVRHQDPYVGPSLAVIGWVYGIVVVSVVVSATAYRRATRGVRGPSRREDAIAGLAVGVPWIAVYVFDGALKANGFGTAIVYGVFDAAGPWLVVGTAFAALAAGREQWGGMAAGLTVVVIGTAAAFFGPAGCLGCARRGRVRRPPGPRRLPVRPPPPPMSDDALDPLIHAPARLRIVVTLAALREGDSLSFPRLQRMLDLTPGNLITHLRKLEDAGYLVTEKSDAGPSAGTSVTLTRAGRRALDDYTATLRGILDGV